ncbi:import inner membrane translocase subunit tim44 mitochondrial precursor [Dioszegia hungarica]|uniref:Mitochondrial import inner membrane translocase subunit TIM44 n=1 Tax=Dioszegia hungarica TaxID=4972 RepID=A0AA38HCR8_9TREE|nr:import inner membrane translocase subunit tim44 mitochondrial precursor [Dioszegia hungarica]KAI9636579.1 import inner membrane translocase subunit tim44 mitochondrial precursor [Dioszegia hungarica]
MKSRPVFLRALRVRSLPPSRQLSLPPFARLPQLAPSPQIRHLSSSPLLRNEGAKDKAEGKKRGPTPEEGSGPVRSPFAVFAEVLKEEISKNKAWQQNVKQLQGDVDKMADSAAMKRARDMYERARIVSMIQKNPRIQASLADMKRRGISVSEAINRSLEDSGVINAIRSSYGLVSDVATRATQPVRDTAVYKAIAASVEEAFEDETGMGSRYGGYEEKEERRRKREMRAKKAGKNVTPRVKANPEAGEALVLTDSKPSAPSRLSFLTNSPTYQRLLENYQESDSPLISTLRSITSTVGSWFDENETARVIRAMKELDPDFRIDRWTGELREYIVPEVVDAYLSADQQALRKWCGEATFNVLWATLSQYTKQGLVSQSRILDIKHVDISTGKMLENNIAVFLVTFATQEVVCWKKAKTGEVVLGDENGVEACRYAMVLTREEAGLEDEVTGGWKVVEMARRGGKGGL